jgi:hypothetical protein
MSPPSQSPGSVQVINLASLPPRGCQKTLQPFRRRRIDAGTGRCWRNWHIVRRLHIFRVFDQQQQPMQCYKFTFQVTALTCGRRPYLAGCRRRRSQPSGKFAQIRFDRRRLYVMPGQMIRMRYNCSPGGTKLCGNAGRMRLAGNPTHTCGSPAGTHDPHQT